jgi:hypothetical protein
VNRIILELAALSDLVLVMLDPIGQALVARTVNLVAEMSKNDTIAGRMRFFLTKADTVKVR